MLDRYLTINIENIGMRRTRYLLFTNYTINNRWSSFFADKRQLLINDVKVLTSASRMILLSYVTNASPSCMSAILFTELVEMAIWSK